jgi:hypothetical protein
MESDMIRISNGMPPSSDQTVYYKADKSLSEQMESLCNAMKAFQVLSEMEEIEEDEEEPKTYLKSISMKTAVIIVVGVHLLAVAGLAFSSSETKRKKETDKDFLTKPIPEYVGVDDTTKDWPQPTYHVVKSTDTFYGIVKQYKIKNTKKFQEINNIKDINVIVDGKKLIIP